MFSTKALYFVLALALYVQALPTQQIHGRMLPNHHGRAIKTVARRGSCKPKPSSASIASSAPVAEVTPIKNNANVKGNNEVTVPTKTGSAPSDDDEEPKSTKATSSKPAAAAPTTDTSDSPAKGASLQGLLGSLFPVSGFSKSWTTAVGGATVGLSDATFRPTKELKGLSHDYVSAPDGKKAMKAHYPKGSYTFGHEPRGGFSFYAPGPANVDLSTAKEATFGYSVFFPEGFEFQLGGKLPGIYGGNSDEVAASCSGGRRDTRCFSARLMWRAQGEGEFYTYLPPYTIPEFAANKKQCTVAPASDCNPTYGASVGRGSFKFATGKWTTVSERVKLNSVGKADGEIQLFVNGKSVINVSGLILRDSAAGKMRGLQMQTFFGGSKIQFASPKAQDVYFSDFSVAITETL